MTLCNGWSGYSIVWAPAKNGHIFEYSHLYISYIQQLSIYKEKVQLDPGQVPTYPNMLTQQFWNELRCIGDDMINLMGMTWEKLTCLIDAGETLRLSTRKSWPPITSMDPWPLKLKNDKKVKNIKRSKYKNRLTTHHQDGQWTYHLTRLRFPFYPRPSFPLGPVSSPGLPPPQNTSDRPNTWPATPSWACWAHLLSNYSTWIGKWRPWKAGCSCKDQDYWRCPVRPDSSQQTPSALSNSIFRPSPTNVNFPTWSKSANSSLSISANKSGRATYPWNTSLWEVMSVIFLCEWFFDNFLGLMCSLASFGDFKVRPILMRWHQNSL